jgi:hypothetical protein
VILKTAASILRVIAGIVAPVPFWGAVRALEISKRALELDVMSLGEPVGGGEAIAIACEAIWWADDFGVMGEFIDWFAQDRVDSFIGKQNGVVGPSFAPSSGGSSAAPVWTSSTTMRSSADWCRSRRCVGSPPFGEATAGSPTSVTPSPIGA